MASQAKIDVIFFLKFLPRHQIWWQKNFENFQVEMVKKMDFYLKKHFADRAVLSFVVDGVER